MKLKTKLFLSYLPISVLFICLIPLIILIYGSKLLSRQADDQGKTIIRTIQTAYRELNQVNQGKLTEALQQVFNTNIHIAYTAVLNSSGELNYWYGPEFESYKTEIMQRITQGIGFSKNQISTYIYNGIKLREYIALNIISDKPSSYIVLGLYARELEGYLIQFRRNVLWLILCGLLVALLLTYLLGRLLAYPFEKLENELSKIDYDKTLEQNLDIINIRGVHEIQRLANRFQNLIERFRDIQINYCLAQDEHKLPDVRIQEIENLRTLEVTGANETLKRVCDNLMSELEMARRVQQNLLPSSRDFSERKEFNVGSKYISVESLGGDLYDIIRVGRNGYGFLISDVSGHGVAAALITTMVKVSFHDNSGWGRDPANVCHQVNKEMIQLIGDLGYYLTAFYGTLNLENGIFWYTNAGHNPALYYNAKNSKVHQLQSKGTLIGAFKDAIFESKSITLHSGDRILFYTDGVTEARNQQNEFYGISRLKEFFLKHNNLPPKDFVDLLIQDIHKFEKGRSPNDDRAIMLLEFVSTANNHMQHGKSFKIEAKEFQ